MSSAFQTLKSNAKLLNSDTPEPGAMEVVFDSNFDSETSTEKVKSNDSDKKLETPEVQESADAGKSDLSKPASPASISKLEADTVVLPKEIVSKLRKFKKYEEKYPGMCNCFMCSSEF